MLNDDEDEHDRALTDETDPGGGQEWDEAIEEEAEDGDGNKDEDTQPDDDADAAVASIEVTEAEESDEDDEWPSADEIASVSDCGRRLSGGSKVLGRRAARTARRALRQPAAVTIRCELAISCAYRWRQTPESAHVSRSRRLT